MRERNLIKSMKEAILRLFSVEFNSMACFILNGNERDHKNNYRNPKLILCRKKRMTFLYADKTMPAKE